MLRGKRIILGITGGIAAYKCPHLVRLLVKEGAEVRVIMSPQASEFVAPGALGVVSKHPVLNAFFDAGKTWNNHVAIAEWADIMLVAPLTANTLAKMATGLCDNLLLSVYLSARHKVVLAPAMDLEMYRHPTTKKNLEQVTSFGNIIIPAESGELASGLNGEGRMAEPENIVKFLNSHFAANLPMRGRKVLVNAGPTYEPIDPVRFIGNRSSGKMGIAIVNQLMMMGAEVTLVMGPTNEAIPSVAKLINVETSREMHDATIGEFAGKDIVICCSAVADYSPAKSSASKIKKGGVMNLELIPTIDIIEALGRIKTNQCLVGFALETENLEENATGKLKKKNMDLIVANPANEAGAGIGHDTNRITVIDRHNKITKFGLKDKQAAARDIINCILAYQGNT